MRRIESAPAAFLRRIGTPHGYVTPSIVTVVPHKRFETPSVKLLAAPTGTSSPSSLTSKASREPARMAGNSFGLRRNCAPYMEPHVSPAHRKEITLVK